MRVSGYIIKKSLINADKLYIQSLVSEHRSLSLLSDSISWPKLWDTARDFSTQRVRSIREVCKLLTRPTFGDRSCPYGTHAIPEDSLFAEHVLSHHLDYSLDAILECLECNDEELFKFAVELKRLSAGPVTHPPLICHKLSFAFYSVYCIYKSLKMK